MYELPNFSKGGSMTTHVSYDDGIFVFVVLGVLWLAFSHELAVIVGLAWAIAGISRSNAIKMEQQNTQESK